METPIAQLDPKPLWQSFAALNAIPRPSKKEAQVVAWLRSHVETLGLTSEVRR